jgi:hypothetical protein
LGDFKLGNDHVTSEKLEHIYRYIHQLAPKEYFRPIWYDEQTFAGIFVYAMIENITIEEAGKRLAIIALKKEMGQKVADKINDPATEKSIRFNMIIRRISLTKGWDVRKIFPLPLDSGK